MKTSTAMRGGSCWTTKTKGAVDIVSRSHRERHFAARISWLRAAIVRAVFWSAVAMAATMGFGVLLDAVV